MPASKRKRKPVPTLGSRITPNYAPLAINESNSTQVASTGYVGRLQHAFELQRRGKDLVSLRDEIAWMKAKIRQDVSQTVPQPKFLETIVEMAERAAAKSEDPETVQAIMAEIIQLSTNAAHTAIAESVAVANIKTLADVIAKEATRARLMESVPTAEEWDVFRKVFLNCVYNAIREFPGISKPQLDQIWASIIDNFRQNMVLDPADVATIRSARERAAGEE